MDLGEKEEKIMKKIRESIYSTSKIMISSLNNYCCSKLRIDYVIYICIFKIKKYKHDEEDCTIFLFFFFLNNAKIKIEMDFEV